MTLDIFIPSLIGTAVGFAAVYGITRLKGIWIIGALLYIAGGIIAFLTTYFIFYPLVADTHYVFISGFVGFCVWSVLIARLFFIRHV